MLIISFFFPFVKPLFKLFSSKIVPQVCPNEKRGQLIGAVLSFLKHLLNIVSVVVLLPVTEAASDLQLLRLALGDLLLQKAHQVGLSQGDERSGRAHV